MGGTGTVISLVMGWGDRQSYQSGNRVGGGGGQAELSVG